MHRFKVNKLVTALSIAGLLVGSSHALAGAFQLWEQDAASVGNYHAGYAAAAYDASIAFYNPAGLTRFSEQQLVVSADSILTSFKYRGTIAVNTVNSGLPQDVTAQGGGYSLVPAMHYVAPLSDVLAFGLSVDVPFGLKTSYGKSTILRYAATTTSVQVIDVSPVLSFKLGNGVSFGVGPDVQLMSGVFNQVATLGDAEQDSDGINSADDTGYGMHAGLMYEANENTRFGLSYHSQVVHHLTGTSKFTGPLADFFGIPIESSRAKVNITLPPYTALSAYHKLNSSFAVMGSVIFTQWNTIQNLVLQDVSGIQNTDPSNSIVVIIPQHFHNTFNFSVGSDYFVTDKITLRGGVGYDQTPVTDTYRNVQMPDNNRYVIALGSHFQTTPTIGLDIGWSHLFINKAHVIPPDQVTGDEITTTNGSVTGGADVFAAQLVWDMV